MKSWIDDYSINKLYYFCEFLRHSTSIAAFGPIRINSTWWTFWEERTDKETSVGLFLLQRKSYGFAQLKFLHGRHKRLGVLVLFNEKKIHCGQSISLIISNKLFQKGLSKNDKATHLGM